jgi:PhnB protein
MKNMVRESVSQRLDSVVEAIVSGRSPDLAPTDAELTGLARAASGLRGLPAEGFRQRLKDRLTASAGESAKKPKAVREGYHTATLYLAVAGAERLVDFVKEAFGATETLRTKGSAGGLHAEVRIGDSAVMIGGYEGMTGETTSAIHLYVEDADTVYTRALEAGGASLYPPIEQPYGDREAGVRDSFGNSWYIATHRGPRYVPEGLATVNPYLHPRGAAALIDFLKAGLGGEEVEQAQSPEGIVVHAKVRIGDSVIELSEAHGPYQTMPTAIFLYVENVDALYERALRAGAGSSQAPSDQPYGRAASVKDPFGTTWHLATPHKAAI